MPQVGTQPELYSEFQARRGYRGCWFKNEVQNNNGKTGQKQEVITWWIGPEWRFLGSQSPDLTLVPTCYPPGTLLLAAQPLPRFTRLLKGSDKAGHVFLPGLWKRYPRHPPAPSSPMPLLTIMSPCSSCPNRVSLFSGSPSRPQSRARSPQPARKTWNSLLPP